MQQKITYEQPLNEKIRTLLRLEFLFRQAQHNLVGNSIWDSRATLASILDILNVCSRSDLKTDILKELERHLTVLGALEQTPGVNLTVLNQILDELDVLVDRLQTTVGQPGQPLRQDEFLNSIKQRSSFPGGVCDFDLPAYHYWSQQSQGRRINSLQQWLGSLDALRMSIELILRLLREGATFKQETAMGGFFQKSLDVDKPCCQLVRVALPENSPYYAEISGGKHRFTVRFMEPSASGRAAQSAEDIDFELSCCML